MQSLWKEVGGTTMRVLGVGRLAAMLLLESVRLTKNAIALPFVSTARTPLTGQVTPGRQFTTAAVAMERVDAIRARTRSTLNHVALTCLDGALRRYLQDQGVDLKRPDHDPDAGEPCAARARRPLATRSASSRLSCRRPQTTPMCACATSASRCATCVP
jgi:hypothetical protein